MKATKSKINYAALKRTADAKNVLYFTKDNVNYIFNSYCIIYGIDDNELEIAIEKSKAIETKDEKFIEEVIKIAIKPYDNITELNEVKYTKVSFNSENAVIEYFKIKDGDVVALNNNLLDIVFKEKVEAVYGIDKKSPILFVLSNNKKAIIYPILRNPEHTSVERKIISVLKDYNF